MGPILRIIIAVTTALSVVCGAPNPGACSAIDLDQGWNQSQREEFWFTTQGSRLMPYAWFMALETADSASQSLVKDKANMDRYGYISMPPSPPLNPDGLPIGFVKDVASSVASSGEEHVGMTCAACHTGWLSIGGTKVIVEGGPTLADFRLFLKETTAGLA